MADQQAAPRLSLGARILVILYAGAIVVIAWSAVKKKVYHVFSEVRKEYPHVVTFGEPRIIEGGASTSSEASTKAGRARMKGGSEKPDKITDEDKKQLQKVLDGLK